MMLGLFCKFSLDLLESLQEIVSLLTRYVKRLIWLVRHQCVGIFVKCLGLFFNEVATDFGSLLSRASFRLPHNLSFLLYELHHDAFLFFVVIDSSLLSFWCLAGWLVLPFCFLFYSLEHFLRFFLPKVVVAEAWTIKEDAVFLEHVLDLYLRNRLG